MSKVNIRITIINAEENIQEEVQGILQDNTLKYKEYDGTTVIYDYLKKSLLRENDELKMTYYFEKNKKTTGTIFIKDIEKKPMLECGVIGGYFQQTDYDILQKKFLKSAKIFGR